jgi:uncharacterized protein involved in exopolysaccharide biosynthesis
MTGHPNGPDLHDPARPSAPWWRPLSEQRWFVVVFVLSAFSTSLALTYVFAEKYESSTAISYRVQEVTRFKAQQNEALGSPAPQAPFKVIGTTLQEVLKSDAVLRDVVTTLRLDVQEKKQPEGAWYRVWYLTAKDWLREYAGYTWKLLKYGRIIEDDPVASAIAELRGNIAISNRDSYIFNLTVRDKTPQRAARIVEYLSSVLSAWLLDFDRQPGRTRAEQLRGLLEVKSEELAKRRKEVELLLAGGRVTSVQQDGEKLSDHLYALQLEVLRLDSEIARARNRLSSVDSKLRLKQRVLERLAASSSASLSASLSASAPTSAVAAAEPSEHIPPEDFKKLASERVFDDLELSSAMAKRSALQTSINDISERLRRTPGLQNRYDTLRLSLASIEREYTMLNDAYQEAALRATSPVSEVRVLHPALVPSNPVSPIKVYHVLLAVGLGLPLAVGLAYLLDFLGFALFLAPARAAARAANGRPDGAAPLPLPTAAPTTSPTTAPAPVSAPVASSPPADGTLPHA